MTATRGTFGELRVWDDFLGPNNDLVWAATSVQLGNFGFVSVNEGTFEWTIDEPGGIVAITTDPGTGGMVGAQFDADGTDDDFRMVGGDAGAASSNADANGTRANEGIVADEWYIVRTVLNPDGNSSVWVGHKGEQLDLITVSNAVQGTSFLGAVVTPTDQFYAVLMFENRDGNARVSEVDYGFAKGWRDWTLA